MASNADATAGTSKGWHDLKAVLPEEPVARLMATYLAARTGSPMLFTFAPSSAFLQAFLAIGRLVPRGDRSPAIVPVAEHKLRRRIEADPAFAGWRPARTQRVARGFYTSQALEVLRGG